MSADAPPEVIGPGLKPAAQYPTAYDAEKPAAEIEQDIARTRSELGETIDALERQFAPQQFLEKGIDMLRQSIDGNLGPIADTFKENPIPLALIGAGIGWLMLTRSGNARPPGEVARQSLDRGSDLAAQADAAAGRARRRWAGMMGRRRTSLEDSYAYARQKTEGAAGRASGLASRAATTARDTAGRVRVAMDRMTRQASDYTAQATKQMQRGSDQVMHLIDEYPLAVGAIGLVAGALIAIALPRSRSSSD